jgi:hypothetical protein
MKRILIACATAVAIATSAVAMPTMPTPAIPDQANDMIVDVATKSYKRAAYAACKRQYGYRLAYVTYPRRGGYVCHFRKSNKALTKQAARQCRKAGQRLVKVTSIRIKGNRSITRFQCRG